MNTFFKYISFILLLFVSCSEKGRKDDSAFGNILFLNSKNFESGDLILRLGNSWVSGIFQEYSLQERLYSHIGVIAVENDSVFVIHSEASEYTGVGGVLQEELSTFLRSADAWGVYRFDTIQEVRNKIYENAKLYIGRDFDLNFDMEDDSKLYCTELIALAVNIAYDRKAIIPTLEMKERWFYRLDDCYYLPNCNRLYSSSD